MFWFVPVAPVCRFVRCFYPDMWAMRWSSSHQLGGEIADSYCCTISFELQSVKHTWGHVSWICHMGHWRVMKSVGIWKRLPMVMVHRIEQPEQTIKGKPAERLCRILGLLPPASKIGPGRQCFMNQAVNLMINPWNWGSLATQVDLKSLPQEQPKDSHCQSTKAA